MHSVNNLVGLFDFNLIILLNNQQYNLMSRFMFQW